MSAIRLDVAADSQASVWQGASAFVDFTKPRLVRQLTPQRGPVQCPECRSIIYSRRHKLCGVCNQPLPEHLLFTVGESQRIGRILEAERARHRRWLAEHAAGV
jgi:hypothetical protein